MTIYTIGHSTRSLDQLARLLGTHGVEQLVDVRTVPRSRRHPWFDREALSVELPRHGIAYHHLAALGGLRHRRKDAPPSPNGAWDNDSFRNYADHALGPAFAAGLDELLALAAARPTAVMCAEATWWRCHRRIIADHLLARGVDVRHIMSDTIAEPATLTPFAQVRSDGKVVYPAPQGELFAGK